MSADCVAYPLDSTVGDRRCKLGAVPVVADRFDGAAFHRFLAETFFVGCLRLLVNVRVAAIIVPFEQSMPLMFEEIRAGAMFRLRLNQSAGTLLR